MGKGNLHPGNILIVDDDADVLLAAEVVLRKHFARVRTTNGPENLSKLLNEKVFDIVLLDMNFATGAISGKEGFDALALVQEVSPDTKVILMTAYGGIETAVKAIKNGAVDFVLKPWDNEKLIATVASAVRLSQASRTVKDLKAKQRVLNSDVGRGEQTIGQSAAFKSVLIAIDKVAATDASVLIVGENGTGKGIIARAIHRRSNRADQAFVHVDLGAITETLFEAELFGHKKGAFTDAREDRPGRFEIASGGTLLLDEIGNLNMQMQAKLLGVLESRTISRVGSDKPIEIDARMISATNMAPQELLDRQLFRQDLLYRINTVEIHVPALRQRREDIPLLVEHYLGKFGKKYDKQHLKIKPATLDYLAEYHWPGNVRELVHAVERAVIMAEGALLDFGDFSVQRRQLPISDDDALNLDSVERRAIREALLKHGGNMSRAARDLGLGRTTLYRKLSKHGL
jgi:DNA-binding NtrC family response regulator